MKKQFTILFVLLLINLVLTAAVSADGLQPITKNYQQQSYPVPQLYPIGQYPNQNYYPGPVNPAQPYYNPQPQTQPQVLPQQPQQYPSYPQSEPQYYYPQNEPWQQVPVYPYNQEPMYDPLSDLYFYRIDDYSGPFPFQPSYPNGYNQGANVQVSKQWNPNGSVNLNWLIRNVTNEDWGKKNIDIKCVSGCHLLTNPEKTLWDLPYSVQRGGTLSFTVNIWQPMYGETMTFSLVAGSKTIYTFNVNPN